VRGCTANETLPWIGSLGEGGKGLRGKKGRLRKKENPIKRPTGRRKGNIERGGKWGWKKAT